MFGRQPVREPQSIGFLLRPNFSMIAFTAAIEPLRVANRQSMKELFTWSLYSMDGAPVKASNGVEFNADDALSEKMSFDGLFVCSGVRAYDHLNKNTSNLLRALARRGQALGSICTGTATLAEAGLLDGYKCTIHWENIESLSERYPKLEITGSLFEVDRNRFTCSGGLAATDMMLYSIELDFGKDISMAVADQLLYAAGRAPEDLQRMDIARRTNTTHPKLLAAIVHMEKSLENPLSVKALAKSVAMSPRQLERLFKSELSTTPSRYYLGLRLTQARKFLRQTSLNVQEIAVATGFASVSYFSKCYKARFGYSPRQEREKR